jgi:hypothetical protein
MPDVTFKVGVEKGVTLAETPFLSIKEIPRVGERIHTNYFSDTFLIFKENHSFEVVGITHFYNDDLSEIDYTEIEIIVINN